MPVAPSFRIHFAVAMLQDELQQALQEQDLSSEPIDSDLLEELFLQENAPDQPNSGKKHIPVKPEAATGSTASGSSGSGHLDFSRLGNTISRKGVCCGSISYLIHWEPASYAANCKVHESCYITASMHQVQESELEHWLGKAPQFYSAEDHIQAKPKGSYNRRRC